MIARIFSVIAVSSLFLAAAAAPSGSNTSQCNSGYVACCNTVQEAKSVNNSVSKALALVKVDVGSLTGYVASNCSPINVLAVGSGASCSSQQVCCQNNYYNGLINVGCSPINVSL
ncbi:hypothetical protein EST38_g5267 [Candolleomyces aberdarensis]|uniref:Hydrophobin n=1 Tax=Candolleomyces aberdarensis TaxID=2316362 RepID=A0A4Q2DKY9_9AGAR|nr:hypothetical protein EST38_g5267 [Candolleomyces aberdarensis]